MSSFMYPVLNQEPNCDWISDMLEGWKNSGKHYLEFSFCRFTPHTLPDDLDEVFWMYLYNTQKAVDEDLRGVVKYRVRVVERSPAIITGKSIYVWDACNKDKDAENTDAKMWFKCDLVEELRKKSGRFVIGNNFEHTEGKSLFQTIRNSIAPINLTLKATVVGTIGNYQLA